MYTTSAAYRTAIMGNVLKYEWSGSLTTANGDVYTFSPDNIDTMGSVTETASDSDRLTVGSVYASELNINFFSLVDSNLDTILAKDFDRYELYGAEIDLECTTCGETIPVGKYVIAETMRNVNMIEVKAYDFMTKFDKRYDSAADTSDLQPYAWLVSWCTACGVTLGSTEWDIAAMANNGLRSYKLAQVVDDLTTYRDALHYLSEILCAVCFIDRNGELVLKNYRRAVDLTIPTTWRWDCQIADYRTMYDGIFTTYVITQESEYTGTAVPVGLVYDFGVNPFLQITDGTARNIVKSNILNDLATITCTPFTATCPLDPSLDLMDVVELSGGVAEPGEYAVLTEITFYMDGTMDLSCSGANPKLQEVVSRVSKVADVSESQTYVNNSGVSIGSTDSYIIGNNLGNSVTITCTTDNQIVELLYTADFTLDEDSLVTCTLVMDGNTIQTYQELYFVGQHTMTVDHYYEISTSGDHTFTATVSAVYSPTPSGISDYDDLTNRPSINGTTLTGNQTGSALGLIDEPVPDGTSGQVLTTDGNGGRSWTSIPSASTTNPSMDGIASYGSSADYARADHVHPSDTNKQDTLVSGTNIKTVNGNSLLGSGDLTISGGGAVDSVNSKTGVVVLDGTEINVDENANPKVPISTALSSKQDTLVSGTNIKTINNTSLLGSGNIAVQAALSVSNASYTNATNYSGTIYAYKYGRVVVLIASITPAKTISSGTAWTNIATAYRPIRNVEIPCSRYNSGNDWVVTINTNGNITVNKNLGTSFGNFKFTCAYISAS